MEQRPLRLGDIVDDYCPRERRVTNHAIVALVNDSIRQTRCTTCDAEHVFKGGKPPRRKPKDGASDHVDNTGGQLVAPPRPEDMDDVNHDAVPSGAVEPAAEVVMEAAPDPSGESVTEPESTNGNGAGEPRSEDIWPANRQLIRATLPRIEGEVPPPRPIPEFTMHQRYSGRGAAAFRQARSWADQGFGGGRTGGRDRRSGQGFGNGNGSANGNSTGNVNGNGNGGGGGRRRRRHGKNRPR